MIGASSAESGVFERYAAEFEDFRAQLGHALEDYPATNPAKRSALSKRIIADLDELSELLKQMEMEAQAQTGKARQVMNKQLITCRKARQQLQHTWRDAKGQADSVDRGALLSVPDRRGAEACIPYSAVSSKEQEMESLIAKSSVRLDETRRVLADATGLGAGVLSDLDAQRKQLQGSQAKLREADSNLAISMAVLRRMKGRALRNKMTAMCMVVVLLFTIGLLLYEVLVQADEPSQEPLDRDEVIHAPPGPPRSTDG